LSNGRPRSTTVSTTGLSQFQPPDIALHREDGQVGLPRAGRQIARGPPRVDAKYSQRPSGDHAGLESTWTSLVTGIQSPPSSTRVV
jgi:hypothetical protein